MMMNIYKKIGIGLGIAFLVSFQVKTMDLHNNMHFNNQHRHATDAAFIQMVVNMIPEIENITEVIQEFYERSQENEMAGWVAFCDFDDDTLPTFTKQCRNKLCWSWGLLSEQNKNEVQVANALDALSFAWINLLWNTALFYGLWNVPDWHNYKELLRIGETFMVRGVMRELQSVCEREKDIDKVIACIDHMKQRFTQDRSFSYGQRVFTEGFLDGFKEKIEILQQECSLSHSKREHHVILEKSIVPRLFDLSEEE